jgi:hypothetical protein
VLLLAGTTFLTISSTESQIALNEQGSARALVLAEAAIHKALAFYYANPNSTYAAETNTVLGGGTFTISVTTVAGCTATSARKIVATGSVPVRGGTAQAQIEVALDKVSYPYQWAAFAAVPNGIIGWLWDPMANQWWDRTNSELLLRDHTLVDCFDSGVGPYDQATNSGLHGDVGANGDVEIDYSSTIGGNVQAGDDLFKESGVTVTGKETTGLSPKSTDPGVPFPTITPSVTPTGPLTVPAGGTVTLSAGTHYSQSLGFGNTACLIHGNQRVGQIIRQMQLRQRARLHENARPVELRVIDDSSRGLNVLGLRQLDVYQQPTLPGKLQSKLALGVAQHYADPLRDADVTQRRRALDCRRGGWVTEQNAHCSD